MAIGWHHSRRGVLPQTLHCFRRGQVRNIQKFVQAPAKRLKTRFSTGEAVKITDGPFSDFLGTIHEIDDEKGRVKVLVSIFGRETPVELDFAHVEKR